MAKAQKRKTEEPVTISKIYEAINAQNFIPDLWTDIITDIHEKPTYKRIKDMVHAFINNTMEDFSDDPENEAERIKRRTTLTEISIMTYTVDTIISELLSKKLMKEFKYIVENIVQEVKPDAASSNVDGAGPSNIREGNQHEPASKAIKIGSSGRNDVVPKKRGRPRKDIFKIKDTTSSPWSSMQETNKPTPPKKGRRKRPPPDSIESSNNLNSFVEEIPKQAKLSPLLDKGKHNEIESDSESVMSLSITSVSSVHTSELSSFEDTISIDGEDDDGEKKQIPLKIANELYKKGTLSEICGVKNKVKKQKSALKSFAAQENSQSSLSDSSSKSLKVLPQRIRKLNSKYASDTMICDTLILSPHRREKTEPKQSPKKLSGQKTASPEKTVKFVNSSPEKYASKANRKSALNARAMMEAISLDSSEEE